MYEPHIAPKVEAWAENYVERRRQKRRQRQGPIPTQPVSNENNSRRSTDSSNGSWHGDDAGSYEYLKRDDTVREQETGRDINTSSAMYTRRALEGGDAMCCLV